MNLAKINYSKTFSHATSSLDIVTPLIHKYSNFIPGPISKSTWERHYRCVSIMDEGGEVFRRYFVCMSRLIAVIKLSYSGSYVPYQVKDTHNRLQLREHLLQVINIRCCAFIYYRNTVD